MTATRVFPEAFSRGVSLAQYSTLGVGGAAEYLSTPTTTADLVDALTWAHEQQVPVTVIGGGSNVLIADHGISGLVILNRVYEWELLDEPAVEPLVSNMSRWNPANASLRALYDEAVYPPVLLKASSGALLSRLMVDGLSVGVTGLEWFAGIPGTVGGAVFMNMHGGPKLFGDHVVRATVVRDGVPRVVQRDYFSFRYDWSVLHDTREIVIDAVLVLRRGPVDLAKTMMAAWMKEKNETQDKRSTGCIFQNISPEEQARLQLPTASAGYVIDRLLDLKGKRIGGAKISDRHGNFMVNAGDARAEDFAILIAYVKEQARNNLGLDLHEEVAYLGFAEV